ncbi:MAG: endonuclease, partial [Planctomycetota bacterium]
MFKRHMKTIIVSILFVLLYYITSIEAKTFKVATYNLENLFDLTRDGTEYPEYIPNTGYGWTKDIANIKYTNIARVIKDLGSDVVALQEVES